MSSLREALIAAGKLSPKGTSTPSAPREPEQPKEGARTAGIALGCSGQPSPEPVRNTYFTQKARETGHKNSEGEMYPSKPKKENKIMSNTTTNETAKKKSTPDADIAMEALNKGIATHCAVEGLVEVTAEQNKKIDATHCAVEGLRTNLVGLRNALVIAKHEDKKERAGDIGFLVGGVVGGVGMFMAYRPVSKVVGEGDLAANEETEESTHLLSRRDAALLGAGLGATAGAAVGRIAQAVTHRVRDGVARRKAAKAAAK